MRIWLGYSPRMSHPLTAVYAPHMSNPLTVVYSPHMSHPLTVVYSPRMSNPQAGLQMPGVCVAEEEERVLSYLPLSHVAGMLVDIIMPLAMTATRPGWQCASFARPCVSCTAVFFSFRLFNVSKSQICDRPN